MTTTHSRLTIPSIALILMSGMSMVACAFVNSADDSWKEEVLLHDGRKIIVERSQSYGGRSEPGQSAPVRELHISFTPPASGKKVAWTSEYDEKLGRTNFNPLALHILNGEPFLVVEPNLCLSYNKWGHPNPPYILFKYTDATWQTITLADFPVELKTINLIVNASRQKEIKKQQVTVGYVTSEAIQQINGSLEQPELRSILRNEVPKKTIGSLVRCEELIYYKGAWVGPGDSTGKRMMDRQPK